MYLCTFILSVFIRELRAADGAERGGAGGGWIVSLTVQKEPGNLTLHSTVPPEF